MVSKLIRVEPFQIPFLKEVVLEIGTLIQYEHAGNSRISHPIFQFEVPRGGPRKSSFQSWFDILDWPTIWRGGYVSCKGRVFVGDFWRRRGDQALLNCTHKLFPLRWISPTSRDIRLLIDPYLDVHEELMRHGMMGVRCRSSNYSSDSRKPFLSWPVRPPGWLKNNKSPAS